MNRKCEAVIIRRSITNSSIIFRKEVAQLLELLFLVLSLWASYQRILLLESQGNCLLIWKREK